MVDKTPQSQLTPSTDDKTLLDRWYQHNDQSALTEIFQRHQDVIYRTAIRYSKAENAEDIVQAVFLILAKKSSAFHDQGVPLRTWLLGITIRTCRLQYRTQTRRKHLEKKRINRQTPNRQPLQKNSEFVNTVINELERLPEDYRHLLELRFLEGLSAKETAYLINAKVNTVEKRIQRALQKLRERLNAQNITASSTGIITALEQIHLESAPDSIPLDIPKDVNNSDHLMDSNQDLGPGGTEAAGAATGFSSLTISAVLLTATAGVAGALWLPESGSNPVNEPSAIPQPKQQEKQKQTNNTLVKEWIFDDGDNGIIPSEGQWEWTQGQNTNRGFMRVEESAVLKLDIPEFGGEVTVVNLIGKEIKDALPQVALKTFGLRELELKNEEYTPGYFLYAKKGYQPNDLTKIKYQYVQYGRYGFSLLNEQLLSIVEFEEPFSFKIIKFNLIAIGVQSISVHKHSLKNWKPSFLNHSSEKQLCKEMELLQARINLTSLDSSQLKIVDGTFIERPRTDHKEKRLTTLPGTPTKVLLPFPIRKVPFKIKAKCYNIPPNNSSINRILWSYTDRPIGAVSYQNPIRFKIKDMNKGALYSSYFYNEFQFDYLNEKLVRITQYPLPYPKEKLEWILTSTEIESIGYFVLKKKEIEILEFILNNLDKYSGNGTIVKKF